MTCLLEAIRIKGVSDSAQIYFNGSSKTGVVLSYDAGAMIRATLVLNGTKYMSFNNMSIVSSTKANSLGIFISKNAQYIEFEDCIIRTIGASSGTVGIKSSLSEDEIYIGGTPVSDLLIKNCLFESGYNGVFIIGNQFEFSNNVIVRNSIFKCKQSAIDIEYNKGLTIQNNSFSGGEHGLQLKATSKSKTYNNNFYDLNQDGILMFEQNTYSNDTSYIVNNMVRILGISWSSGTGVIIDQNSKNVNVYNNTISVDGLNIGDFSALMLRGSSNIKVKNNILNSNGKSLTYYEYMVNNLEIDYNLHYSSSTEFVRINYIDYSDMISVQNAYPNHQNSIQSNPNFISKNDIHLSSLFPPFYGTNDILDFYDYDNDPRCIYGPTIGADESKYPHMRIKAGLLVQDTLCYLKNEIILSTAKRSDPVYNNWYINEKYISDMNYLENNFSKIGYDTIKLVTFSCGGIDSVTKIVYTDTAKRIPDVEFISLKHICETGERIVLNDLTNNCPDSLEWDISPDSVFDVKMGVYIPSYFYLNNTSRFSRNPELTFTQAGNYKVCLTAKNNIGINTLCKNNYIIVKAGHNICNYVDENVRTALSGNLFDDGGQDQDYANNRKCNLLLTPCASSITLKFEELDIAKGDYFRIYDGTNSNGRPLWDTVVFPIGIGNNVILGNSNIDTSYTSNSGSMYIEWESDESDVSSGFRARWDAEPKTSNRPIADFSVNDTVCANMKINFFNKSIGDNLEYSWFLDNSQFPISYEKNPVLSFHDTGLYNVRLEVISYCHSQDSIISKQIAVIKPQKSPKVGFYADNLNPIVRKYIVSLEDTSFDCVNSWNWKISPSSFKFVNGTSANEQNPQVIFYDTCFYNIKLISGYENNLDSIVKNSYIKPIEYCSPAIINISKDIGIKRFALDNINNESEVGKSRYTDYSSTINLSSG